MQIGTRVNTLLICLAIGCTASGVNAQMLNVTVQTIDGRSQNGTIRQIDPAGNISGLDESLNLGDVAQIFVSDKLKPSEAGRGQVRVFLFGGSEVSGTLVELQEEKIRIRSSSGNYSFSLQSLRGVIWNSKQNEMVRPLIEKPDPSQDRVIVGIGDQIVTREGLLESLTATDLGFKYQGKSRSISMDKIRGLVMADLGIKEIEGLRVIATTKNWDRWVGVIQSLQGQRLNIAIDPKSKVELPVDQVVKIEVLSDRLAYLSDLQPASTRESSQFVVDRSFKKDQSVGGKKMRLLDESGKAIELAKGIGVQATSELTFDNPGFDRLQALVGIDLETRGRGNCVATVNGDGIRLWEKKLVGGQAAIPLDVNVAGIEKITLVVSPGQEFDLADHVNWGEIRLLKTR